MTPEMYFKENPERYPNFVPPRFVPQMIDVGGFEKQMDRSGGWLSQPHPRSFNDHLWDLSKPIRVTWDFLRYYLPGFIRRLIAWTPILWADRDFDWEYLGKIIDFKLGRLQKTLDTSPFSNHPKDVRDIAIARKALRRLMAEDYDSIPLGRDWRQPGFKGAWKIQEATAKDDLKLFLKKMSKMRGWWD